MPRLVEYTPEFYEDFLPTPAKPDHPLIAELDKLIRGYTEQQISTANNSLAVITTAMQLKALLKENQV